MRSIERGYCQEVEDQLLASLDSWIRIRPETGERKADRPALVRPRGAAAREADECGHGLSPIQRRYAPRQRSDALELTAGNPRWGRHRCRGSSERRGRNEKPLRVAGRAPPEHLVLLPGQGAAVQALAVEAQ